MKPGCYEALVIHYSTYIVHYFVYPQEFRVAYAANISQHQMRERTPHRELHHLHFSNINKELLVMQGQYSFPTSPKSLFYSRIYCHICKMKQFNVEKLLLRPVNMFYVTCMCTCLPCAVVKKSKINLFTQKLSCLIFGRNALFLFR